MKKSFRALPQRASSTVVRINSITKNDQKSISDVPMITTPHFDVIPQFETEEHKEKIDLSKAIIEQTIRKQSKQVEKEEMFFLPFYEVAFQNLDTQDSI